LRMTFFESIGGAWGLGICSAIVLIFALAVWACLKLYAYYKNKDKEVAKISNELDPQNPEGVLSEASSDLSDVITSYINILRSGNEPNISALISTKAEKDLPHFGIRKARLSCQSIVRWVSSIFLGLGLLGTFIGFMWSLSDLSTSLDQSKERYSLESKSEVIVTDGNVNQEDDRLFEVEQESIVQEVISDIKRPLNSMPTAFMTSIFGLVASIIISLMTAVICPFEDCRRHYFGSLIDLLENRIRPAIKSINEETQLEKVLEKLSLMIETLKQQLTLGFKDGFSRVSEDFYELYTAFSSSVQRMDKLISQFIDAEKSFSDMRTLMQKFTGAVDNSVNELNNSVGILRDGNIKTQHFMQGMQQPLQNISESIQAFMHEIQGIQPSIDGIGQELLGITSSFRADSGNMLAGLVESQNLLVQSFEEMKTSLHHTIETLSKSTAQQISQMISEQLSSTISEAASAANEIVTAQQEISSSLVQNIDALKAVSDQFGSSLENLADSLSELPENIEARLTNSVIDSISKINQDFNHAISEMGNNLKSNITELIELKAKEIQTKLPEVGENKIIETQPGTTIEATIKETASSDTHGFKSIFNYFKAWRLYRKNVKRDNGKV